MTANLQTNQQKTNQPSELLKELQNTLEVKHFQSATDWVSEDDFSLLSQSRVLCFWR